MCGTARFGCLVGGQCGGRLAEEVTDSVKLLLGGHESGTFGLALLEGFFGKDVALFDELLRLLALHVCKDLLSLAERRDRIACLLSTTIWEPDCLRSRAAEAECQIVAERKMVRMLHDLLQGQLLALLVISLPVVRLGQIHPCPQIVW